MYDIKLEIQKSLIYNALKDGEISQEQYNVLLKNIESKQEETRLQNKLKDRKNKEVLIKPDELIFS